MALFHVLLQLADPPLPAPDDVFELIVAGFYLHVAEASLAEAVAQLAQGADMDAPARVISRADAAMGMLAFAARGGAAIADAGQCDMLPFMARCESLRVGLATALSAACDRAVEVSALTRVLPPLSAVLTLESIALRHPIAADELVDAGDTLVAARALALENLSWQAQLAPNSSFVEAQQWAMAKRQRWLTLGSAAPAIGILDTLAAVEALVLLHALRLPLTREEQLTAGALLPTEELVAMDKLVELYADLLHDFIAHQASAVLMRVALRGRAALVSWAVCCLVHQAAWHIHPTLQFFSLALDHRDLEHLVLPDARATDAMLHVAAYVAANGYVLQTRPAVFSGRPNDLYGTYSFAERVGEAELQSRWDMERSDANKREQARWSIICRQKEECAQIRRSIADLDSDCSREQNRYTAAAYGTRAERDAKERINTIENQLMGLKHQLTRAQSPPAPLLQPLPRSSSASCGPRALFFAITPELLTLLAHTTHLAYAALADCSEMRPMCPPDGVMAFREHFDSYSNRGMQANGSFTWMTSSAPQKVGGSNVEHILSSSDGVWHPADGAYDGEFQPMMRWEGVTRRCLSGVNPFASTHSERAKFFTETLPPGDENEVGVSALQWTASLANVANTAASRGNEPVARLSQRPSWLSKPEFITVGSLRAFHRQQTRRLCVALHDDLLPLERAFVATLVRQTLYHVGEVTAAKLPAAGTRSGFKLSWRNELFEAGALATLADELENLADHIASAPRRHKAVLILGDLASFLGGYESVLLPGAVHTDAARCSATARTLCGIATRWANELEEDLVRAEAEWDPAAAVSLRAKQHMYLVLALNCMGTDGPLSAEDAVAIIALRVRIHATQPLLDCDSDRSVRPAPLLRAQAVVAARIPGLLPLLDAAPEALTTCARHVLPEIPQGLSWTRLALTAGVSACYDAVITGDRSGAKNLVSINCETGAVLFNGVPPNHLPDSVLAHALYARVFGVRNCSVVPVSDSARPGCLRTTRPLDGRAYTFWLQQATQRLEVVEEVSEASAQVDSPSHVTHYTLLDTTCTSRLSEWCGELLPPRLLDMHSHWITRDLLGSPGCAVIVFRSKQFSDRGADYIATCGENVEGSSTPFCVDAAAVYRVPPGMRDASPNLLLRGLSGFDRIVAMGVGGSADAAAAVLAKFESPPLVHGAVTPAGKLRLEMPRYGLSFQLRDDGALHSLDYGGYIASAMQQLPDTLATFSTYLLLELAEPAAATNIGLAERLVIVPARCCITPSAATSMSGATQDTPTATSKSGVKLDIPIDATAALRVTAFSIHPRFGTLVAPDIAARLQLACLYAATSSFLPEQRTGMSGGEHALELLRGCWVNRPLVEAERKHLCVLSELAGTHLAPAALSLLCSELHASSRELDFLYDTAAPAPSKVKPRSTASDLLYSNDAAVEFQLRSSLSPRNSRHQLSAEEQRRSLGYAIANTVALSGSAAAPWAGSCVSMRRLEPAAQRPLHLSDDAFPALAVGDVHAAEARLVGLTTQTMSPSDEQSFPLALHGALDTCIGRSMVNELRDSWDVNSTLLDFVLSVSPLDASAIVCTELKLASEQRAELEAAILAAVDAVPVAGGDASQTHWHAPGFRMLRAANDAPVLTLRDIVRAMWAPDLLLSFNPLLSPSALVRLRGAALQWGTLCVLEDRLTRVHSHLAAANGGGEGEAEVPLAVRELRTTRDWDVHKHPQRLAFEVEQGLQVRPQQLSVLNDMIADPAGAVCQLNMGLGKTRVILPLLLLHWADGDTITRLHLLSQLLDEGFAYLHSVLTAGVLGRRIFLLPFSRDVAVTAVQARAMMASLLHCKRVGGALIVAPEHRMSLTLKFHELRELGEGGSVDTADALRKLLTELPYADVFDESDAALRHLRQLVYAVGVMQRLPSGDRRWSVVQAVLRVCQDEPVVLAVLQRTGVAVWDRDHDDAPTMATSGVQSHWWDGLRLLPGQALDAATPDLHSAIMDVLIAAPPRQLGWLKLVPHLHSRIRSAALDSFQSVGFYVSTTELPVSSHYDDVMSLRGLLAHGVLKHCLQLRHRVDFGVARADLPGSGAKLKRLAVPFVASDTPSPRTEFAQPDVALVLTHVAYHADGLRRGELKDALAALLKLGPTAQANTYAEWFASAKPHLAKLGVADCCCIDTVSKLDLTNETQIDVLHQVFGRSTAVADFWLARLVLRDETVVYPQRLVATPWQLADGTCRHVGFSGTNDAALLLPLTMHSRRSALPALLATNGHMLASLLRCATYESLDVREAEAVPAALVRCAVATGAHALIDAGALMAGCSNAAVAAMIARELRAAVAPPSAGVFRGVVYYETGGAGRGEWVVLPLTEGDTAAEVMPLRTSPIPARDAFAYFDEAHCRGADLKLRRKALAVLSLCPRLCKDALMQAAGRLRGLNFGQRIKLVAPPEVDAMLRCVGNVAIGDSVEVRHVLEYAVVSAVQAVQSGLPLWARHGYHDVVTRVSPTAVLEPDSVALVDLYARADVPQSVNDAMEIVRNAWLRRGGTAQLTPLEESLLKTSVQRLNAQVAVLGSDVTCRSGAQEEQCERETEREVQQQEEMQLQLGTADAAPEVDWDLEQALLASAPSEVVTGTSSVFVYPLHRHVADAAPPLTAVPWAGARVWVTSNFASSVLIEGAHGNDGLANYLRPVDALLVYPEARAALLVSEREVEALLGLFERRREDAVDAAVGPKALLVNLAFLRSAADAAGARPVPRLQLPYQGGGLSAATCLDDATLAALQLFAGEAQFTGAERQAALRALIPSASAALAARNVSRFRGTELLVDQSDLDEAACLAEAPRG